jgi:hypothetical protein
MTTVTEGPPASAPASHSRAPDPTPLLHWRVWVTKHPIAGAAAAGTMATFVATIFGFWLGGIGLPQIDWPIANGSVVLGRSSSAVQFSAGEFINAIAGVVFTLIFVVFLYQLLGRSRSPVANLARGILFGLVLATLAAGFLVPYVYYPHIGAGIFGSGFGWKAVVAIYVWHLVFGVNLGLLYSPLREDDPALA